MKLKINQFTSQFENFLFFAKFLKPYWKIEVSIIVLSQLVVVLGLINPYLTKLVIDNAFKNKNLKLFITILIVSVIIFLLKGLLNSSVTYYSQSVKEKASFDLNKKTVSRLYSLDLDFYRNSSSSGNLYKIFFDTDMVISLVTDVSRRVFSLFPTFILTFVIVLKLNWQMGLMVFILGFTYYFHSKYFTKKQKFITKNHIEQKQRVFSRLNEVLQKIYLVKAAGKEADEEKNYTDELTKAINIFFKTIKVQIASNLSSQLIRNSITGLLTVYGGYHIIKGEMTLGTFTSIMVYLSRVSNVHADVSGLIQRIIVGFISSERLKEIYDVKKREKRSKMGKLPSRFNPEIILKDVSFSYKENSPLIEKFNMIIKKGEWTALTGPSGRGKTTIINLILGLYTQSEGEITVSGVSTEEVNFEFILKNISIAPQEPFLWNISIKENLLYFSKTATQKDLNDVLQDVNLLDVVIKLPKGFESDIGDDACRFSVGQKQRLSLARALISKPKILVFDEALSSVDIQTSDYILKNIKTKYPDLTVLLISHNPKDLNYCDRIYNIA